MKHMLNDYSYILNWNRERKDHPITIYNTYSLPIKILKTGLDIYSGSYCNSDEYCDTKVEVIKDGKIYYTQRRFISPKEEKPMEYKITKTFSIIDIAKKRPCWDSFIELLEHDAEIGLQVGAEFRKIRNIEENPILSKHLPWLADNGFIEEVKKETALTGGMILKNNESAEFLVLVSREVIRINTGGKIFDGYIFNTLEELNDKSSYIYHIE